MGLNTVERFRQGQVVKSTLDEDVGIIIGKSSKPDPSWYVVLRKRRYKDIIIKCIHERYLVPYSYLCPKCSNRLDSSTNPACDTCGWLICGKCGSCSSRRGKCRSRGFRIMDEDDIIDDSEEVN